MQESRVLYEKYHEKKREIEAKSKELGIPDEPPLTPKSPRIRAEFTQATDKLKPELVVSPLRLKRSPNPSSKENENLLNIPPPTPPTPLYSKSEWVRQPTSNGPKKNFLGNSRKHPVTDSDQSNSPEQEVKMALAKVETFGSPEDQTRILRKSCESLHSEILAGINLLKEELEKAYYLEATAAIVLIARIVKVIRKLLLKTNVNNEEFIAPDDARKSLSLMQGASQFIANAETKKKLVSLKHTIEIALSEILIYLREMETLLKGIAKQPKDTIVDTLKDMESTLRKINHVRNSRDLNLTYTTFSNCEDFRENNGAQRKFNCAKKLNLLQIKFTINWKPSGMANMD